MLTLQESRGKIHPGGRHDLLFDEAGIMTVLCRVYTKAVVSKALAVVCQGARRWPSGMRGTIGAPVRRLMPEGLGRLGNSMVIDWIPRDSYGTTGRLSPYLFKGA